MTRAQPASSSVHPVIPDSHHRFALAGQQGQLDFSVQATIAAPWTVLFGPSGSGKSSILRAIAGLLPDLHARFDRFDPMTSTWRPLGGLAPEHRDLAYAPQQALLLPHLTAEQNLRFPEAVRGLPATQSHVPALISLLHLEPLLHRRPAQLSGGERQRIALARALAVPQAKLLLLDEPFAGLDRGLRNLLLPGLRGYLLARGLPVLSVTHDPDEALLLDADVLRLHEGRITLQGAAPVALGDEIARLHTLLQTATSEPFSSSSAAETPRPIQDPKKA